jgi:hypothetical protein
LRGVEADEFFLFTHGRDIAEVARPRAEAIEGALARFSAREGDQA